MNKNDFRIYLVTLEKEPSSSAHGYSKLIIYGSHSCVWKKKHKESKNIAVDSGGARPNVGVGDISFARPFSLPSQKYERGRRRSPTSPTPSAATGCGYAILVPV
ncbi:hypothetical protein EVAR_78747_1 [Eumeta japonica]|uniref:Uncharacterized protein n=1 Tax=Eumeta variegata TaxID=151549 RepID=A0A4C1T481_EUMVA|nr:hypothetical protein EVAR_78747_1 [Eumeta japonica]